MKDSFKYISTQIERDIPQFIRMEYPYFVDIRSDGMTAGGAMTAGLPQITMNWASPITVTERQGLRFTRLLQSTHAAWVSDSTNMLPDYVVVLCRDLYCTFYFILYRENITVASRQNCSRVRCKPG